MALGEDFLRAVQSCPYVAALDYNSHHCFNPAVKIAGYTRMFEGSPECISKRTWYEQYMLRCPLYSTDLTFFPLRYHPDMIVGACIELIGDPERNPLAPRKSDFLRADGYAHNCETRNEKAYNNSFGNIAGNKYPLWSAADFRRQVSF